MPYRISDFTRKLAESLVDTYGSISAASRAIVGECETQFGTPARVDTVKKWILAGIHGVGRDSKPSVNPILAPSQSDKVNRIQQLLDEANIPIEAIGKIEHVKIRSGTHHQLIKNADGEAEIHPLHTHSSTIMLTPSWEEGPKWPLVQPAAPVSVAPTIYVPRPRTCKTIIVLPDTQIGFLRTIDGEEMVPMHDLTAIDVALQIVADIQPDGLGWIGDFLDFSEMSRWLQVEEFWRTTQASINAGHEILAQFEAAAGQHRERTWMIAGNHDRRLREYVTKNARAAFNLRPAQSTPESWPDLTFPHLLRLDDLSIDYCGEYPGSEKWITPNLVARHNPEKVSAYDASVIAGHSHALKQQTFSHRVMGGTRHHSLYEIGCLCRIDNFKDKNSLMATSVPSDRGFVTGWTQGLAIVYVDDDGHSVQLVEIKQENGTYIARYADRIYSAKEAI